MAKKTVNFNAIRPLIVIAHNADNKKPINKDMCDGAGIDHAQFVQWTTDVKALQKTVEDYVEKRKNARFDANITQADVESARNRIYPKWKELLHCCEESDNERKLHVCEADVEDLIGFEWDFHATGVGTGEKHVGDLVFRRKVESLLGCMIAERSMLTEHEVEILDRYARACKAIQNATDEIATKETEKKDWELRIKGLKPEEISFAEYIKNTIKKLDDDIKTLNERKSNAEAEEHETSAEALSIRAKVKYAGK